MGSIHAPTPAHRLSHQQILGHTRVLCLALAETKIQGIRGILKEKKHCKELIFVLKHLVVLLAMTLVSELACLRVVSVLLLLVLIALSFYILFDALKRCQDIESRLTHEIAEMSLLTEDEDDSDRED